MGMMWKNSAGSRRRLVLLAPYYQSETAPFQRVFGEEARHRKLLAAAQRLRGRVYLADSAIKPSELTADGRHVQVVDELSWHLLIAREDDNVAGCIRYYPHRAVAFRDLAASRSAVARSPYWANLVEEAVEAQIAHAKRCEFSYVELGGWALSEELRGGQDAIRMLLTVYALARLTGEAVGISTATTRHRSSSILRRLGGKPLMANGLEVPPYYDPQYDCEMELLCFDSTAPNPQFATLIEQHRRALLEVPVILAESATRPRTRLFESSAEAVAASLNS
jgi:hypothetical protein